MKTMDKINEKSGDLSLTYAVNKKDYSFIIDGSMNKDTVTTKWYISNLKASLKSNLMRYPVKEAYMKTVLYMSSLNGYVKQIPFISLGICKKNEDKVQILILNDIKCYAKAKNIKVIEDTYIKENYYNKLGNNYVYSELSYDKYYSILMFNKEFDKYQKHLKLDNESFNTLVKEQGFKYCKHHLSRIQNSVSDITGVYKVLI